MKCAFLVAQPGGLQTYFVVFLRPGALASGKSQALAQPAACCPSLSQTGRPPRPNPPLLSRPPAVPHPPTLRLCRLHTYAHCGPPIRCNRLFPHAHANTHAHVPSPRAAPPSSAFFFARAASSAARWSSVRKGLDESPSELARWVAEALGILVSAPRLSPSVAGRGGARGPAMAHASTCSWPRSAVPFRGQVGASGSGGKRP